MKTLGVIGIGRMRGALATAFAKRTARAVSLRESHTGSSSAAALSRQSGVRVADDKELLAADVVFVATGQKEMILNFQSSSSVST